MREPKGVPGRVTGDAGAAKSRGLDVRFASGADAAVSRRLKEMYDGLVSEPVPDRFLDLLNQLDNVETPRGTVATSEGTASDADPTSDPSTSGPKL